MNAADVVVEQVQVVDEQHQRAVLRPARGAPAGPRDITFTRSPRSSPMPGRQQVGERAERDRRRALGRRRPGHVAARSRRPPRGTGRRAGSCRPRPTPWITNPWARGSSRVAPNSSTSSCRPTSGHCRGTVPSVDATVRPGQRCERRALAGSGTGDREPLAPRAVVGRAAAGDGAADDPPAARRAALPRPAVDPVVVLVRPAAAHQVDVLGVAERRAAGADRGLRARRGSRRAAARPRPPQRAGDALGVQLGARAGSRRRRCCRCRRSRAGRAAAASAASRRPASSGLQRDRVEAVGERVDARAWPAPGSSTSTWSGSNTTTSPNVRGSTNHSSSAGVAGRGAARRGCAAAARRRPAPSSSWPLIRRWTISVVAGVERAAAGTCRGGRRRATVAPVRPSIDLLARRAPDRPLAPDLDALDAPADDARGQPAPDGLDLGELRHGRRLARRARAQAVGAAAACSAAFFDAPALAEHRAVDDDRRRRTAWRGRGPRRA